MSDSLWSHGLYSPWNSPGQNTGILESLSCVWLFYNFMDCSLPDPSVHRILQASILEWVALPSSRGSSWPRDWTWGSCIAGRFFTDWAIWETLYLSLKEHLSKSRSNSHLWESSKANLPGGKNLHQVSPPYAFHRPPSLMHKKGQFLLYSQYFPVTFKELTVIELQKINDGPLNF